MKKREYAMRELMRSRRGGGRQGGKQGRRWGKCLILILAVLSGCGGSRRDPRSAERPQPSLPADAVTRKPRWSPSDQADSVDRLLALKVLPEGDQSHYPAADSTGSAEAYRSEAFVKGNAIRITHPIPLMDPAQKVPPYFLVWSERAQGNTIVSAYYEHQVEGVNGLRAGSPERVPVPFDRVSRRWFIPIQDLFKDASHPFTVTDLHCLFLELELDAGTHVEVEVQFQVSGAGIPRTLAISSHRDGVPPTRLFGGLAREGWVFMEDSIRNPVQRTVKLWFRILGADFTVWEALTDLKAHAPLPGAPPVQGDLFPAATVLTVGTRGMLRLAGFRISLSGQPGLFQPAGSGDWISVLLNPLEEVRIQGWAAIAPGTRPSPYRIPGRSVDYLRVDGHYETETGVTEVNSPRVDPASILRVSLPSPLAIGDPAPFPPRLNITLSQLLL